MGPRGTRRSPARPSVLGLHQEPEDHRTHARPRVVHVARERRDPRFAGPHRPGLGPVLGVLGWVPSQRPHVRSDPERRRGHRHVPIQRLHDDRDPDPCGPRDGGVRLPEPPGSALARADAARRGGTVPHHAVRRVPGQHHDAVRRRDDPRVHPIGADLVGSARRAVHARDPRGVHAPDDVCARRRLPLLRVRLPRDHCAGASRRRVQTPRAGADVGRVRDDVRSRHVVPAAVGPLGSARRRGAAAPLQSRLLQRPASRLGAQHEAARHVHAGGHRDRGHHLGGAQAPQAGRHLQRDLDLVPVPLHRLCSGRARRTHRRFPTTAS